jgi:lactate 2-monooxygenase
VRQAQEQGKFTVLFDSGIRTGSDVIKAIAMGAQGVLGEWEIHYYSCGCFETHVVTRGTSWSVVVGRPVIYGLAIGGEQGVEEVLRGLLADTEITLGLSGYKDLDEIWGKREAVLEKADAPRICACAKL